MSAETATHPAWWGPFELVTPQCGLWRIGPLDLWLLCGDHEWHLVADRPRDAQDATLEQLVPAGLEPPETAAERARFAGLNTATGEMRPALADRPVVSRPEQSFYVPGGAGVTLYVSTPVWLQLYHTGKLLYEMPIHRPSDTWFGPRTIEGELCYASRSHCRLTLGDVPWRPHRAVTPVQVRNEATEPLFLERLNLPVPRLSLYADSRNQLWTQTVELIHRPDRALAEVRIGEGAPDLASAGALIAAPRQTGTRHFMARAFSALFQ